MIILLRYIFPLSAIFERYHIEYQSYGNLCSLAHSPPLVNLHTIAEEEYKNATPLVNGVRHWQLAKQGLKNGQFQSQTAASAAS
jgi:hypothetical protein